MKHPIRICCCYGDKILGIQSVFALVFFNVVCFSVNIYCEYIYICKLYAIAIPPLIYIFLYLHYEKKINGKSKKLNSSIKLNI